MKANGATWKIITVCILPVMFFIGKGVIDNDRIRQQEDKEIRQEMAQDRKEINESLTDISSSLAVLANEQKNIKELIKNGS